MSAGQWHGVEYKGLADGEISAECCADGDSPWFSGHFPGAPILPGIAQLAMALEAIRAHMGDFTITEIRRVRFKQMIRPDDLIRVTARPSGADGMSFSFRLTVNGEPACTGTMVGAAAAASGK